MFLKKGIPIELDKKRYLRLDLQGLATFELKTKKPIFLPATISQMTPAELGILFWCCLLCEGLSLTEAGKIWDGLDEEKRATVGEKLFAAWLDAQK